MFLIAFFLVPVFVPRFWMVLLAAAFCTGLAFFLHWNAMSTVAGGFEEREPNFLDMAILAIIDGAKYLAIATAIYVVKRLFVRRGPRKLSNID